MKADDFAARRVAETLYLTDSTKTSPNEYHLGSDIDDDDRLSKGSDCCAANVQVHNGQVFCSKCGSETIETFEDDDEYLERIADEEAIKEEEQLAHEKVWEAFDFGEDDGYS